MATIKFVSIPSDYVNAIKNGALDAHGMEPEVHVSDGSGLPCRHCQKDIEENSEYLVLAYKPFDADQPYAEVGPIFLHATSCLRYEESDNTPAMFTKRQSYLLKGYNHNHKIVYGTGKIISPNEIASYAKVVFKDPNVAYAHLRSALNNCYTCRIERAL